MEGGGDPLDWRLAVAAAVIMLTLAGGTLLVAQVEDDLSAQIDAPIEPAAFDAPDDSLKMKGFKLPKDLPMQFPPGTEVSPDLSKLTLPKDVDLQLPENLDLSGLNFDLPEDFDLQLPEGTEFDASKLKLPNGANLRLPDGTSQAIPPGTTLDLPPELAKRLLDQGLPVGRLPRDQTLSLRDLPPGLDVGVDPPPMNGGGSIRLPAGTEIKLPPGARLPPYFAAGALAYAASHLLPAGTEFDIPLGNGESFRGRSGDMPLPRSRLPPPSEGAGGTASTASSGRAVETEIDRLPARARKGETFRVEGFVRDAATGQGLASAPVEIFANETKAQPGALLGRARTDANGRFALAVEIPEDKPARQWQLVVHALAFTSGGTRYSEGWGDPPMHTYATTALTLTLPTRTALRASTPLAGTLLDSSGVAVASAPVDLWVDGTYVGRGTTGADGGFRVSHAFTSLGARVVEAHFPGVSPYYEASNRARGSVYVDENATLELSIPSTVMRGGLLTVSGRALNGIRVASGVEVQIATSVDGAITATTDSNGRFAYSTTLPQSTPLGPLSLTVSLPSRGVVERATTTVVTQGVLDLDAPSQLATKEPVPVDVRLVDDGGAPLAGVPVVVRLSGPGGAHELTDATGDDGRARFALEPPNEAAGVWTVTATVPASSHVSAKPVQQEVRIGATEIRWSMPANAVRGKDLVVEATVLFAGQPVPGVAGTLSLFGDRSAVSNAQGRLTWTVPVPAAASPGGHEARLLLQDGSTYNQRVNVIASPVLALDVPKQFTPGDGIPAEVVMKDDATGDPLAGLVEITMRAGNWSRVETMRTDAEGRWKGSLPTDGAPAQNLTVTARAPASPGSLEAQRSGTLAPVPEEAAKDRTRPGWLLPVAGVLAVGGAGALAYSFRDRLRPAAKPQSTEAAPLAPVAAAPPSDLAILPQIPLGEPAVWGVGEPLDVVIRSTATQAASGSVITVVLDADGAQTNLPLDASGVAHATLVPERETILVLQARRRDEPHKAPAEARVEILDYRKAVARDFDAIVDAAHAANVHVTRRSTPREAEAMLLQRLGADAAPLLDEVALLMEITNYSQAPVARRDYLRFHDAARRLVALLAEARS